VCIFGHGWPVVGLACPRVGANDFGGFLLGLSAGRRNITPDTEPRLRLGPTSRNPRAQVKRAPTIEPVFWGRKVGGDLVNKMTMDGRGAVDYGTSQGG